MSRTTGGEQWKRLARIGNRDDLVIDNIVIDATDSLQNPHRHMGYLAVTMAVFM